MKVTKFEHATVLVEKAGTRILIDPGNFLSAVDFPQLDAIVVTHEHPDHWTPDQLDRLHADHPDAVVYTPDGAAQAMASAGVTPTVTVVHAGDELEIGELNLKFFGGKHNVIHSSIPVVDNLGVLVDEELFHPGDSYTVPGVPVGTLAAPVGGPWLKIGEAMDYVLAVKPARAIPIHDMTLSVAGRGMHETRLEWAVQQGGGELIRLAPSESTDL